MKYDSNNEIPHKSKCHCRNVELDTIVTKYSVRLLFIVLEN